MRLPRARLTVLETIITVACCALVLAMLRDEMTRGLFFIIVGPVAGALAHQALGGRGILGGMIGGIAGFWVAGAVTYALAYLDRGTITVDLLGPVLGFLFLGSAGATVGLAVGVLLWWLVGLGKKPKNPPGVVGSGEL
jgi:hypothetical protein